MKQGLFITVIVAVSAACAAANLNALAATAKPKLAITAPKAGLQVSNEVFEVTGKASGGTGVSNVWCRVNANPWVLATGTTNWNASADLAPGTNTLLAYAEDTGGNLSTTGKVSFFYVVLAPLTVQTNGLGKVTPDYDGKWLEIGKSYTMTAKAGTGCTFDHWGGSILTNKPALNFLMASNLGFIANFKDVKRPVCVITSPKVNQKTTDDVITAAGKASDNIGVSNVWYQLDGAGWSPATIAVDGKNWTAADLALVPGAHLLQAFASDAAGNASLTNSVKFLCIGSPDSLAGINLTAGPTATGTALLSFGTTTFSQTGGSAHHNVGVGTYTYAKTGPASGEVLLTFVAPPPVANDTEQPPDIRMGFTTPTSGFMTNVSVSTAGYAFTIKPATSLAPGLITGKTLQLAKAGGGKVTVVLAQDGTFTTSATPGTQEYGTYTYASYSPAAGMLALFYQDPAAAGAMNYIQLTFTTANSGTIINTLCYSDGSYKGTATGTFALQ